MKEGSKWRKWDLHFHSPSSYDYKNNSVQDKEIVDELISKGVEVIAITDHHIIDIERVKNIQKLGNGNLTVLPGIEFRAELGGKESIHFIGIFGEDCDLDDIWTKLQVRCHITEADILNSGGHQNVYCDFKETSECIHELGGIVTVHAGGKSNTIESIGNNQEYKKFLKKEMIFKHIDVLELGKEKDAVDYDNIVFPTIGLRRPMIICSDNHNIKKYEVKQSLWIKADPTFQGLRQIVYEPNYRVHIGPTPPIKPPLRISKVKFSFPEDSKFQNERFCLSGETEISFSPFFTCLIGGRGTGKSTILNLIHEKLEPGKNKFFKDKVIQDSKGNKISVNDCVTVDDDDDEKYIEFLSQNEIEEFATNSKKLTQAIYSRILRRDSLRRVEPKELELQKELELLNKHIANISHAEALRGEVKGKRKELEAYKKIIESFSSDEYRKINSSIKTITESLADITSSKESYHKLIKELSAIRDTYLKDKQYNQYDNEVASILGEIKKLIDKSATVDFSEINGQLQKFNSDLEVKQKELKLYLEDKGLTEENKKDIADANLISAGLEQEIERQELNIAQVQKQIVDYKIDHLKEASAKYNEELENQLQQISQILEEPHGDLVKPISLTLDFNVNEANERIFANFKNAFAGQITRSNIKGDLKLKEVLLSCPPTEVAKKERFLQEIRKNPSTSQAKSFLLDLFSDTTNYEVYRLICTMVFLDKSSFKRIQVKYDGRPVEKSSFGQRCTAAIVILLLLGNNPIIIDEPEAHLDSYLISNYLVEVIKESKKNRQIIFATHNANFVLNGDAELIHILNIDPKSQSTIQQQTTIENLHFRDQLIALEGGQEAFKKRENKYRA